MKEKHPIKKIVLNFSQNNTLGDVHLACMFEIYNKLKFQTNKSSSLTILIKLIFVQPF